MFFQLPTYQGFKAENNVTLTIFARPCSNYLEVHSFICLCALELEIRLETAYQVLNVLTGAVHIAPLHRLTIRANLVDASNMKGATK